MSATSLYSISEVPEGGGPGVAFLSLARTGTGSVPRQDESGKNDSADPSLHTTFRSALLSLFWAHCLYSGLTNSTAARSYGDHDTHLGWQVAHRNAGHLASLAADKGHDWMNLREKLREDGVRPLINRLEFRPIDHAHDARICGPRYRQRSTHETVFSTTKRTLGDAMRARTRHGAFRELVSMCADHDIKRAVSP